MYLHGADTLCIPASWPATMFPFSGGPSGPSSRVQSQFDGAWRRRLLRERFNRNSNINSRCTREELKHSSAATHDTCRHDISPAVSRNMPNVQSTNENYANRNASVKRQQECGGMRNGQTQIVTLARV